MNGEGGQVVAMDQILEGGGSNPIYDGPQTVPFYQNRDRNRDPNTQGGNHNNNNNNNHSD